MNTNKAIEKITVEDILEEKGLKLEDLLKFETRDGGELIVTHLVDCYSCGTEQEDTQRFCVSCNTCLH